MAGYAVAALGPRTVARAPRRGGHFVALGTSLCMTSNDGDIWTSQPGVLSGRWNSITYSTTQRRFVACESTGASSTPVMYSDDLGVTWTYASSPVSAASGWNAIEWGNGIYVLVGAGGEVATSTDGDSWTSQTGVGADTWFGLKYCDSLGLFVAVGGNSAGHYVMTSPTGVTWTAQTPATNGQWAGIAWSHSLGIITALPNVGGGGAAGTAMWSSDATSWTTGTTAQTVTWPSIAWGSSANVFVAVSGFSNYIQFSADGKTWSQSGLSYSYAQGLNCVCWSDTLGKFVALAAAGSTRAQLSTDGKTWTSCTSTTPTQHTWACIAVSG